MIRNTSKKDLKVYLPLDLIHETSEENESHYKKPSMYDNTQLSNKCNDSSLNE